MRSKQNPGRPLPGFIGVCASLLVAGIGAQPVSAQYMNYLPWALGSSLLYPLRMFGGYSVNGMSGYNNPAWYGGNFLNQASRGSGGLGYGGYDPNGNPNFYEINSDDPARQNNQAPPLNPAYPSQPYSPAYQGPPPVLRYGAPIYQPAPKKSRKNNSQANAQSYQPNYSQPGSQYSANGPAPGQLAYGAATPNFASGQTAPFAVSFVNIVNDKYDGDIRRALANPETKAWASSLGLVDSTQVGKANLTEERVGVIGRILHDSTLDPVSKLAAIKILLRS